MPKSFIHITFLVLFIRIRSVSLCETFILIFLQVSECKEKKTILVFNFLKSIIKKNDF